MTTLLSGIFQKQVQEPQLEIIPSVITSTSLSFYAKSARTKSINVFDENKEIVITIPLHPYTTRYMLNSLTPDHTYTIHDIDFRCEKKDSHKITLEGDGTSSDIIMRGQKNTDSDLKISYLNNFSNMKSFFSDWCKKAIKGKFDSKIRDDCIIEFSSEFIDPLLVGEKNIVFYYSEYKLYEGLGLDWSEGFTESEDFVFEAINFCLHNVSIQGPTVLGGTCIFPYHLLHLDDNRKVKVTAPDFGVAESYLMTIVLFDQVPYQYNDLYTADDADVICKEFMSRQISKRSVHFVIFEELTGIARVIDNNIQHAKKEYTQRIHCTLVGNLNGSTIKRKKYLRGLEEQGRKSSSYTFTFGETSYKLPGFVTLELSNEKVDVRVITIS